MATLHYSESGQGEPLILLHSGGMSGAEWKPQIPLFARQEPAMPQQPTGGAESTRPKWEKTDVQSFPTCGRADFSVQWGRRKSGSPNLAPIREAMRPSRISLSRKAFAASMSAQAGAASTVMASAMALLARPILT